MTRVSEYRRLRAQGLTASAALRAAVINVAWDDAEARGLVRVVDGTTQYRATETDDWRTADVIGSADDVALKCAALEALESYACG